MMTICLNKTTQRAHYVEEHGVDRAEQAFVYLGPGNIDLRATPAPEMIVGTFCPVHTAQRLAGDDCLLVKACQHRHTAAASF